MAAKMLACTDPMMLLCIAIDGADQSAFATPYFCQETKESVRGWKLKMKLIGALVSGRMCMFYTLGSNWESGKIRRRLVRFAYFMFASCPFCSLIYMIFRGSNNERCVVKLRSDFFDSVSGNMTLTHITSRRRKPHDSGASQYPD